MSAAENDVVHRMNRQLVVDMYPHGEESTITDFRRAYEEFLAGFAVPADAEFDDIDAGGVPSTWCSVPGAATDKAIIHFHSGGYVIGSARGYRQYGARLAAASGARVLMVDYRLAPDHAYPAAKDDCLAAYRWLAGELGSANIVVSGDSAGGGLALLILQAIRDAGEESPAGGVAVSPFTDLTVSGPSAVGNEDVDPLATRDMLLGMAATYLGGSGTEADDPSTSPLFASFAGLPPLFIAVGDIECLRDDARRAVEKARSEDVAVTFVEGEAMVHIWPLFADRLEEARETLNQIGLFAAARLTAA